MKFKNVIVRRPGRSVIDGIPGDEDLGKVDYELALKQHDAYIEAMKETGAEVDVLEALEDYPDSTFVEDPAVLTPEVAIITRPGADTRRKEIDFIIDTIKKYYPEERIEYIKEPGLVEGGDVIMAGNHFYIGVSGERTNKEGARQFIEILEKYGHTGEMVEHTDFLHLKTGATYIENNNILTTGEFANNPAFKDMNELIIPEEDGYSVNVVWMNDYVLMPEGFPETRKKIEESGDYKIIELDCSEIMKINGGLTCLSLRFSSLK